MAATPRDIANIKSARSIKGCPLSAFNVEALEQIAKQHRLLSVEIGSASSFSKPKAFFREKQAKFQFIQEGKITPFDALSGNQPFVGFQIRKQRLVIFAYFPGEY